MEGSENMVAVESTGTRNEIKERYEKNEKFEGIFFYFPLPKNEK